MILTISIVAGAAAAAGSASAPAAGVELRRVVALLDYVAGDYARAVGPHGELLSEAEHQEQVGFVNDAAAELRADTGGKGEDLARKLDALGRDVVARAPPTSVASRARAL